MSSKIDKILRDGLENLQIVLDFDRTITDSPDRSGVAPSLVSFLRESNILGEEYHNKAQANFDHYHPIEKDENIERAEKNSHMQNWWHKHLTLVVEHGLNKEHIHEISNNQKLIMRQGIAELLTFCNEKNIPMIIFSANVLGTESIKYFLQRFNMNFSNIKIITNNFTFDESGKAISFRQPLVHSVNKNEVLFDVENIIQMKNTILAVDSLTDAEMISDKDGSTVYRVGITNSNEKDEIEKYKKHFDQVTNNFHDIINLLK